MVKATRQLPKHEEVLTYAETDAGTVLWTYFGDPRKTGEHAHFRMWIEKIIDPGGKEHVIWQNIDTKIVASAVEGDSPFAYTADLLRTRAQRIIKGDSNTPLYSSASDKITEGAYKGLEYAHSESTDAVRIEREENRRLRQGIRTAIWFLKQSGYTDDAHACLVETLEEGGDDD